MKKTTQQNNAKGINCTFTEKAKWTLKCENMPNFSQNERNAT